MLIVPSHPVNRNVQQVQREIKIGMIQSVNKIYTVVIHQMFSYRFLTEQPNLEWEDLQRNR